MIAGSYQKRKSSTNQANVGWRDGYLGSENNWGSLARGTLDADGDLIDGRYANITNRPEGDDVYQVPQNASYDLNDVNRERINGQAGLHFRPTDDMTARLDEHTSDLQSLMRISSAGFSLNTNT